MPPPPITRRLVDRWLMEIAAKLASIRAGSVRDILARLGLLEQRVEQMRDQLGVRKGRR